MLTGREPEGGGRAAAWQRVDASAPPSGRRNPSLTLPVRGDAHGEGIGCLTRPRPSLSAVPLIPFIDTADRPAPASRSSDLIAFGLAVLALAAAAGAQAYVQEWPWLSVAGFVLGGTLLAVAARRLPVSPDPA